MLEIGSEFWNVETCETQNSIFPNDTKWFLSGQNALNFIIADLKSKRNVSTVALPSWCCDSMIIPFTIAGLKVEFYPVTIEDGTLRQNIDKECDIILIMDYFGYSSEIDLSSYSGIVIRDLTHSLFSKSYKDADYFFGSLRKWTGFYTGGYAFSMKEWNEKIEVKDVVNDFVMLRKKAMDQKSDFIQGKSESKDFLNTFGEAEDILDDSNLKGVYAAYQRDVNLAMNLDYKKIKEKRIYNAKILIEGLSDIVLFKEITKNDCPLFVPVITNKRDELKKILIQNHVYCPSHWPISQYHKLDALTKEIYDKELSLICDQRYGPKEMNKILNLINGRIRNNY